MILCPKAMPFDVGKHAVIYTGNGDETHCLRCWRNWPTRQTYEQEVAGIIAEETRLEAEQVQKIETLTAFLEGVGFITEPVIARKLSLLEGMSLTEFEDFLEVSREKVARLRHELYLNIEK